MMESSKEAFTKIADEAIAEIRRAEHLRDGGKFDSTAEDYASRGARGRAFIVLAEEVGEIARDQNDNADLHKERAEWIQVIAVAMGTVRGYDRYLENYG